MQYENREIPEKINYTDEHPVKEFLWLLFAVGTALAGLLLVLHLSAKLLAPLIPFSYEQKIAQSVWDKLSDDVHDVEIDVEELVGFEDVVDGDGAADSAQIESYLQKLADDIVNSADLPKDMSITVHYSNDDTVNAFATIGGHVVIYEGLLEKIDSENALTMLMAHEIGHIKYRDPIVSLSRGVISSLAIGLVTSSSDNNAVSNYLGTAGLLTQLSFSRAQEERADELALSVVKKRFGHSNGAEALFIELQEMSEEIVIPGFLNSHPATSKRIERITSQTKTKGKLTPLPEFFEHHVEKDDSQKEVESGE